MNLKRSGTHVRLASESARSPRDNRGTQVFTLLPRAAESGPGVTILTTVGIGGGQPPRAPATPPAPPRPTREAKPVTAQPSVRGSKQAQTFAAPTFSTVPDAKGSLARTGVPASGAASPARGAPAAGAAKAPLLRAFDASTSRPTSWATASTLMAPLAQLAAAGRTASVGSVGSVDAVGSGATGERASSPPLEPPALEPPALEPPALEQFATPPDGRAALRVTSETAKKVVACIVVAMVVVSGSLVARNAAERNSASGRAEAPVVPTSVAEPLAAAMASTPERARTLLVAPVVEETMLAPRVKRTPTVQIVAPEVPREERSRAVDKSRAAQKQAPGEVTLARQAVDALLAGDRPKALQHYTALSRRAPDLQVYREAVRLLTPAASDAAR